MPLPTRSLYAVDPRSHRPRLVVQVEPHGWQEPSQVEEALCALIPALDRAAIDVALLASPATTFVIRRDSQSRQFEVDEVATAEALSPLPLVDDPAELFACVEQWFGRVASDWRQFVPQTALPKRVPEIVPLVVGSELRSRDGSIGLPEVTGAEAEAGLG